MKVVRVLDLKLMLVTVFFVKFHFIDETTTKKKEKKYVFPMGSGGNLVES